MALYEYNLFLSRHIRQDSIISELFAAGTLKDTSKKTAIILDEVKCLYNEYINREYEGCPLFVVELSLDDRQIENLLNKDAQKFISWLWEILERHNIAYAFMGGGSYSECHDNFSISGESAFRQMGSLVSKGNILIAHPVMFFAEWIGDGKICGRVKTAPFYSIDIRPEIGCLLMLLEGDIHSNSIEILEPGLIYSQLKEFFQSLIEDMGEA